MVWPDDPATVKDKAAAVGLVYLDKDCRCLQLNQYFCNLLGCSQEELLGKSYWDITSPEEKELEASQFVLLLAGKIRTFSLRKSFIRNEGEPISVQVTCSTAPADRVCVVAVIEDMERCRQVEDELRWAKERYDALFDRSMDCIYLLDLDGRFIDANPSALRLLGYERKDLPSRDFFGVVAPEHIQQARERMEQVLREGYTSKPAEYKVMTRNGQVLYVETEASLVCHDGKPVAIQGIARDVSDRKSFEDALRESEWKFRSLAENMHAGVGIVQGQRFVYANSYMARMLGYTVEETLSLQFPQLVHMADREQLIDYARRRQAGEAVPTHYEFRALTKTGETRWIDFSVSSMIYRGKPAIIGTGIDITPRKEAEDRLKAYTAGFKLMADSATRLLSADRPFDVLGEIFDLLGDHLGVNVYLYYLVTEEGTRLRLNRQRGLAPAFVEQIQSLNFGQGLCGIVAQEMSPLIIENVQRSLDPKTAPIIALGIRAYACHPLLGRKGLIGTLAFCAEDRDRFTSDELELMRMASHQGAMAIEHRQLADELERRADQLAEANSAKDHFLAVLSHELRTPLTPVVLGISVLQDRKDLDPKTSETLQMIRSNVEMEARLIDDLLDVTRIVRGKVELHRKTVELGTIIERVVDVCRPDIEARRLHFGVDMGSGTPYWIQADSARLQQVFWNLLKNAIKFTPNEGCVGITCRGDGGHVDIDVNDSGMGIEPGAMTRLFNAFEQTERSITRQFGGLGLGLAISKGLVEMHGGQITAYSEGRNKGATFRVRLPLSAPASRSLAVPLAAASKQASIPLRILVVEDHGITAQMINLVLTEVGHTVENAGDLATALRLAEQNSFDLLICDLGLPDGSGHDLMRTLRAQGYSFPGIALSGYGQEGDIRRSYEVGFSMHLIKPTSREAIIETVASVMSGTVHAEVDTPISGKPPNSVFDPDKALERCFNSPEMLKQMIEIFPGESADLIGRSRSALDQNNLMEVRRAVHRLKGDLVYLGAQAGTDAAAKIEQAAKSGDHIAVASLMPELEHEVELLKRALPSG